MKTLKFILVPAIAVALAVASLSSAHAAPVTVLDFDLPAATPTNTNFGNYDGTSRSSTNPSTNTRLWGFDPTSSGRFWTTPWGSNNIPWFSGGLEVVANNPSLTPGVLFVRMGGSRQIVVNTDMGPTEGSVQNGLFVWNKSQFINEGDVSPVSFSSLNLNLLSNSVTDAADGIRFVIQNAGQYYLSQSFFRSISGAFSVTGTEQWAAFNPTSTDFDMPNAGSLTFDTSSSSLTSVTQVGFAFRTSRPAYGNTMYFDDFSFSGTVVPEPSTYAMLLGGGIGAVALLRRRKKA